MLIQDRFLKEYNEAGALARFYGFQPILPPEVHKNDLEAVKEKAALLRMYFEEKGNALAQPAMFWMERPFKGTGEKKRASRLECSLISFGSSKAITDCLTVRAGLSILQTLGFKDTMICLNSIGDKESASEFERKFSLFVKKNFNSFPSDLRQALKKDIFVLAREVKEEWRAFKNECPKPIDFLSEESRAHFKEVLEFLEVMDISYVINHSLIGDPHFDSETLFSFVSEKAGGEILASCVRSNRLAKKLGFKKEIPFVMLNINARLKRSLKKVRPKASTPNFYLVQFGPEAKQKSLIVLEELRKAGKSVLHSIARDKLASQISIAEDSGIPYILLLGQKEALENAVLLRNAITRAQELIPISDIASRIKKL